MTLQTPEIFSKMCDIVVLVYCYSPHGDMVSSFYSQTAFANINNKIALCMHTMYNLLLRQKPQTSLVVQWLRIRLPVQGTQV